jgi:sulfur carrier protein
MNVVVNGEARELPATATVASAVEAAGADASGRGIAVAIDGQVVPRQEWDATSLLEGQQVEVLRAVQGG